MNKRTFFVSCFAAKNAFKVLSLAALSCFLLSEPSEPAAATARQQTAARSFQYDVTVTLKLVQVYVTDKSGMPVRDLVKEDFALTDNGKLVNITDFEKHDLRMSAPSDETSVSEAKPAAVPASRESIKRRFIILFDFAFNTQKGASAGIKAALDFLDTQVASGDETALISYSTLRGLTVHEFLTSDAPKVRKAVVGLSTKEISGRADEVEQTYWLLAKAAEGDSANARGAEKELRDHVEPQRRDSTYQAQEYFLAMTRLAQALRLVPGQKNILFFSNGVPSSLVNSTRTAGGTRSGRSGGSSDPAVKGIGISAASSFEIGNSPLRPYQKAMLEEFSASNCSFYAFDTRESSKIPSLFISDELQTQTRIMVARDVFRDERTTGMDSLRTLSKQTGGKYFSNILRYEKSLEEVSAVTGTYYVLGYSIPAVSDGKFHDVKVEVKRKGCQVRTQPGYFNPKPFKEYTKLEKDIHLFALVLDERPVTAVARPLSLSALSYYAGRGPRVQILARIPKDIWPEFEGKTAELVAAFLDGRDELLSLQRATVSQTEYSTRDILFTAGASAPPGPVNCRVIIRNLETGRSAVGSAKTHVAAAAGQALTLSSPLILAPGGGLYRLEGVIKEALQGPPWNDIYAFDASAFSPVVGGEKVTAPGRVTVIVPFATSSGVRNDIAFHVNLVNSETAENVAVLFEPRELTVRAGLQVQNLEISLEGVVAGSYLLYVHAADRLSGAAASAFAPLNIAR